MRTFSADLKQTPSLSGNIAAERHLSQSVTLLSLNNNTIIGLFGEESQEVSRCIRCGLRVSSSSFCEQGSALFSWGFRVNHIPPQAGKSNLTEHGKVVEQAPGFGGDLLLGGQQGADVVYIHEVDVDVFLFLQVVAAGRALGLTARPNRSVSPLKSPDWRPREARISERGRWRPRR